MRATSRTARSFARFPPAPVRVTCVSGRGSLLYQAVISAPAYREDELIGIRHAELDAVGIAQRLALGAFAVDENAVAAVRRPR